MSKEAKCHILEQGMKKEHPLIEGTRRTLFIIFNQAKREPESSLDLHGTSAQRFKDPQEPICLEEKPPVYQSISLDVSWFSKQESMLRLLQAQTESGKYVRLQN